MEKTMRGLLKNDQKKVKLRLHKETLTLLEDSQLWPVAGGLSNSICSNTAFYCCQLN
jgi:hypothetical protein